MGLDAFHTLGLPPTFDLDPQVVEQSYFAKSARLHPDLAAGDPDAQREMAHLNQARKVLEDPEQRANLLLARLGGSARDRDRSLPDGFLAEMMEIREEVEAAIGDPDPRSRSAARAKWEAWAEVERSRAISEVGAMFRALGDAPDPGGLQAIRTRLNAWRYVERLIEQLDPDYDPQRADFDR